MKGGYPYKKHTKNEGNGNRTQRISKDEMARPLKRDIRISSEMATDAKRWSVMVKNIDNGLLDGKILKQLILENTINIMVMYDTGFSLGTISRNKCHFFTPFSYHFWACCYGQTRI